MVSRPVPRRTGLFHAPPLPSAPPIHPPTPTSLLPHSHALSPIPIPFSHPSPSTPSSRLVSLNRHHRPHLPLLSVSGVPKTTPPAAFTPGFRVRCPGIGTIGRGGRDFGGEKGAENVVGDCAKVYICIKEAVASVVFVSLDSGAYGFLAGYYGSSIGPDLVQG